MNNLISLIAFFNSQDDADILLQAAALIEKLDIQITIFDSRLVVIMSDVSRAIGQHPKDFAKNFAWSGKARDLSGAYRLLKGKALQQFKLAFQKQNKDALAPYNSLYIADVVMLHSYLSSKLPKQTLNLNALYAKIAEMDDGEEAPF